ncbi:hypothetical protein HFO09_08340 [Rhizobium laguerreae]|uniref:hypothetical protein n=1 Tax=Rhizobium laguerreae TaxID=1076926 RepID=UPI001C920CBD|nr:hypothetical protein [Rhizobium laguerreae]MBY3255698.1 hypothetical protein [Rhizobium laguerreae]MBY3282737.1 hypothetical protein [Rhizobium laguerreae]MBY3289091.1 hypothetical protein [Rhizobium laguerreae]
MAVAKNARDLLFYDLTVQRRAQQAPFPDLIDLALYWLDAAKNGKAPAKKFNKGSITAIVKAVEADGGNGVITLLIEMSDRNAPDTTYLDHEGRTSRHIPKVEKEGSGASAHVFISSRPQKNLPHTYLTLIEAIPSVPVQKIQATLNAIINHVCEADPTAFKYQKPGGVKKDIPYRPHIALGGYPSDRLMEDLEHGKILGMKLVSPVVKAPLGQSPFLKLEEHSIKVSVSKDLPEGQRWKTLLGEAKMNKAAYPTARINVQPEKDGKSFSVDVDAETGNIIGEAYVKVRRVGNIDPPISNTSPDEIVPQFQARAIEILLKERSA